MDGTGFFKELWEAAKLAGPFGTLLMVFIWWRADQERLRVQKEQKERDAKLEERHNQLLERVITGMNDATTAIRGLKDVLQAGARNG